jgi:hypothetical protein
MSQLSIQSGRAYSGEEAMECLRDRDARRERELDDGLTAEVKTFGEREIYVRNVETGFVGSQIRAISAEKARSMAESAGVVWTKDFEEPEPRVIPWRMSDSRVDRYGDIVLQNWQLDNYRLNPIVIDSHKTHETSLNIVGNAIDLTVEKVNGPGAYSGEALVSMILFATESMSAEADSIYRLARARLIRAGSVGFHPSTVIVVEDDEERASLGLGRFGVIYDAPELAEYSIVSVPANVGAVQNSLRSALSSRRVRAKDMAVVQRFLEIDPRDITIADLQEKVAELTASVYTLTKTTGLAVASVTELAEHISTFRADKPGDDDEEDEDDEFDFKMDDPEDQDPDEDDDDYEEEFGEEDEDDDDSLEDE